MLKRIVKRSADIFFQAKSNPYLTVQVHIYESGQAFNKVSVPPVKILVLDNSRFARRLEHIDSANMAFFSLPVRGHCGRFSNLAGGEVILATESKEEANAIVAHLARIPPPPGVPTVAAVA